MELSGVVLMLLAGGAIAVLVLGAITVSQAEARAHSVVGGAPDRSGIAASILVQLLVLGGTPSDQALRCVRREAGHAGAVTPAIDIGTWAEAFATRSSLDQRRQLLESAVRLIASSKVPAPLLQYSALLDLSFSLGFQTDALARLRAKYGFEYIDPAKAGRPREADRAGGATSLFVREGPSRAELLLVLGIEGPADRRTIIATYRRLVAQHHPDRFHDADASIREEAAARFIEITKAYERLLSLESEQPPE